jgi:quercetin dioxygenase-like cupin family protein
MTGSCMHSLFSALLCSILFSMAEPAFIPSGVYHYTDLIVKRSEDREGRRVFEGSSTHFAYLEMHTTTQQKGAMPKPPHAQQDLEELMIVTGGNMKFTLDNQHRALGEGSAILIPPHAMQAVENTGDGPLSYYVLEFRSHAGADMQRLQKAGGHLFLDADSLVFKPSDKGGGTACFDRATAMCERLEMHLTQLDRPGPSHAPHLHTETELVLMLEGSTDITIAGKHYQAGKGDVVMINSNEMHGISNAGDTRCRYLAIKWK